RRHRCLPRPRHHPDDRPGRRRGRRADHVTRVTCGGGSWPACGASSDPPCAVLSRAVGCPCLPPFRTCWLPFPELPFYGQAVTWQEGKTTPQAKIVSPPSSISAIKCAVLLPAPSTAPN